MGGRLNSKLDYRHGVVTTESVFLQTVTYVENVAFVTSLHARESGAVDGAGVKSSEFESRVSLLRNEVKHL